MRSENVVPEIGLRECINQSKDHFLVFLDEEYLRLKEDYKIVQRMIFYSPKLGFEEQIIHARKPGNKLYYSAERSVEKGSETEKIFLDILLKMYQEKLATYKSDPLFSQTPYSEKQIKKRMSFLQKNLRFDFIYESIPFNSHQGLFRHENEYGDETRDRFAVNIVFPQEFDSRGFNKAELYASFIHELEHAVQWVFGLVQVQTIDRTLHTKMILQEIVLFLWPGLLSVFLLNADLLKSTDSLNHDVLMVSFLLLFIFVPRMILFYNTGSSKRKYGPDSIFASLQNFISYKTKKIEIDARDAEKMVVMPSIASDLKKLVASILLGTSKHI